MKFILHLLLIFFSLGSLAQTNCKLSVLNLTDSSKISYAKVDINFYAKNLKSLKVTTDSNGFVELNLPAAVAFDIMVSKDGFKPLISNVTNAPLQLVIYMKPLIYDGEEVTVTATRVGNLGTATFSLVTKKEIAIRNYGQDLPVLIQNTPSAVATSDAGTGIGYTGIRIRGIDPTRINVSINGVPLNDAESQGVFWVNMPDFASGVENIQVQRGVGTSTSGAASFGASINIKTDKFSEIPYAKLSLSQGSFNTSRQSLKFGTGKLNHDWYAEGRMSWIKSDGYIDRAKSDLQAWNVSLGHKTAKSLFQVIAFSGSEKTYQAWNGVPLVKYLSDTVGVESLITNLGYDSSKAAQLRTGNPYTYNYYTYANETDNYKQSHLQLIYNRILKKDRTFNVVFHGTLGKGYYENFEYNTNLSNFMDTPVIHDGNKYYTSNLIQQRWLDNNFAGIVFSYSTVKLKTNQTFGGGANIYNGRHFGKVVWHEFMTGENQSFNYYDNKSLKTDENLYWKVQHRFTKEFSGFTDLQARHVYYEWYGPNETGISEQQHTNYLFFNPKLGIQYQLDSRTSMYLTYGRGSHEPIRDDFINSSTNSRPKPEFLNNIEAAYKSNIKDWKYSLTGYYMGYKDQLALSGKINDVGGYSRINVPKSYRLGLEIEVFVDINAWLNLNLNLAVSKNKIKEFTEYVDDYTKGGQVTYNWNNTDMALSPNKVLGSQFTVKATKNLNVILLTKFVARQYLDNTQTQSRSLDQYVVNDIAINYQPKINGIKQLNLGFLINNFSNHLYTSNGYSYSGIIDVARNDFSFVYPQAGINIMAKIELLF